MIRGMALVCLVLPRPYAADANGLPHYLPDDPGRDISPGAPLIITNPETAQPRTLVADFHSSRRARAKLLR